MDDNDWQQMLGTGSRLRAARTARGWSQARLIHEIERRLRAAGTLAATTASLKVYVSEWENDRRAVGSEYRAVLRAIFGMTDAELFVASNAVESLDEAYVELARRIDLAQAVDLRMIDTLGQQTELFRTMDRQLGAHGLVDQMRSHLATLDRALAYAVLPNTRRPAARMLSSASTLAGWQALDVGAVDRAWRHYETARRAAGEAGSPALLAHAMGEQAYVLVDLGRPAMAVELIREAQRTAVGKIPDRLRSWLFSAEAEMCALAGDENAGRRALDLAASVHPGGTETRDPEVLGVFLNEVHLRRWRGNALALMGDTTAVDDLYAVLGGLDDTFTRAAAGLRLDLAQAHLARSELVDAREHVAKARLLASRTGSLRHRRRLDQLVSMLTDS